MVISDTFLYETQTQLSSTLTMLIAFYSQHYVLVAESHTNEVTARSLGQGLKKLAVTANYQRPR